MSNSRLAHFSAGRVILFALFCAVIFGALLLALPISRHTPMAFIDLLFTSTSVACVTGIFTVPIEQFTFFGHCIILALMQIGGLGIVTLTLFLLSLFVNLGLATSLMANKLLELESWKNVRHLLGFIIIVTFTIEAIGALLFFTYLLKNSVSAKQSFYQSFMLSPVFVVPELPYLTIAFRHIPIIIRQSSRQPDLCSWAVSVF